MHLFPLLRTIYSIMQPPFLEFPARQHALVLMHLLTTSKVIDFDGDASFPVSSLFADRGGLMFGVLVAEDADGNEVVLKAFSGSCKGQLNLVGWVPHLVDPQAYEAYLATYDRKIKALEKGAEQQALSRQARLAYTDLYRIRTIDQKDVSLFDIFGTTKIPTGSGDCCAIKLLHWAFVNHLKPLSMAEFFYGSDSQNRRHGSFYGPCDEKCKPILAVMLGLDIVYHDRYLVVVNKQAGLLSVPGIGEANQDSVESRLRKLFWDAPKQCAVHRLDMDTSGLLVLALTKEAHREMSRQFMQKQVQKTYIALLAGVLTREQGTITLPFRLDVENRPKQIYDEQQGKWGTTLFERLKVEQGTLSRVRFTPLTGRTHQLRVHSAHPKGLCLPIVGDRLYGNAESTRLHLHAESIRFTHPITKEPLYFYTPAPF